MPELLRGDVLWHSADGTVDDVRRPRSGSAMPKIRRWRLDTGCDLAGPLPPGCRLSRHACQLPSTLIRRVQVLLLHLGGVRDRDVGQVRLSSAAHSARSAALTCDASRSQTAAGAAVEEVRCQLAVVRVFQFIVTDRAVVSYTPPPRTRPSLATQWLKCRQHQRRTEATTAAALAMALGNVGPFLIRNIT